MGMADAFNEPALVMSVDLNGSAVKPIKRSRTPHDPSTPTTLTYGDWEVFDANQGKEASLTKSNGSQFSRLSLQNIAFANGSRSSNQLQRSFSPNIISEDLSSDPHQFKGQRQSNSSSRMFKKRHSDFSLSKQ